MPIDVAASFLEVLVSGEPENLDPVDSAIDALARYFRTVPGIVDSFRGWPEWESGFSLEAGPVISIVPAGDPRTTPLVPTLVRGATPQQLLTADLEQDVQIDLWCAHRYHRDILSRRVQDRAHNQLPHRHGIRIRSRDYYNRPMVVTLGAGRNIDDFDAAELGQWRRSWLATVQTDLVTAIPTHAQIPTQQTIRLRIESNGSAEPDRDIT